MKKSVTSLLVTIAACAALAVTASPLAGAALSRQHSAYGCASWNAFNIGRIPLATGSYCVRIEGNGTSVKYVGGGFKSAGTDLQLEHHRRVLRRARCLVPDLQRPRTLRVQSVGRGRDLDQRLEEAWPHVQHAQDEREPRHERLPQRLLAAWSPGPAPPSGSCPGGVAVPGARRPWSHLPASFHRPSMLVPWSRDAAREKLAGCCPAHFPRSRNDEKRQLDAPVARWAAFR